ncbi:MAG: heme NO-binding domain-containing protein [Spirosomataceae bacterium]
MKGIVFTEFFEMVEKQFGYSMVDELVESTPLHSKGIYTAVGTYDHQEMVSLVVELSQRTQIPIPDLLKAFGRYLFQTFTKSYHHFFANAPDAFTFLSFIHNYIHVEVKKLYPDAELPHFDIEHPSPNQLIMNYRSTRKMANLALGLIEGTFEFYHEAATIQFDKLSDDGSEVRFIITK